MQYDIETIVIGAGVIGLAIARELSRRGQEVLILEEAPHFGEGTSSRNSEVIHAGIYYPKDSLKARFCVDGKKRLYRYCEDHAIPHQRTGKLIVATTPEETGILAAIQEKARNNGVDDIRRLSRAEAEALEPAVRCEGALLSPSTGIIDTHQYMLSLVGEIESHGGAIAYLSPFEKADILPGGFQVEAGGMTLTARKLINSAGLQAQGVAENIRGLDAAHIPTRHLTKGSYFTMHAPSPFRHLIYPVPNTASLGIHVTLDLAGQIRFGPDQQWVDDLQYDVDPARADDFYDAIRKYYPDLKDGSLIPAYSGIRPKIQGPNDPAMDFAIYGMDQHGVPGLINLFGMESPGLTSSLAIADHVADLLERRP
ncbi:NAD(P)/FAD-dependent oxidoreductase [Sneathiella chinensis]|uniref:Dehydrogenase n=1 Tax=Sneathiella chinensis TaxID=349750 RepID=A0ABQ5U6F5_9PROT|nr:NAD(P)/FAD-dependent oxidoreductase [Sneathiella chinensis]GLQ07714.1 dehydrogenase [Sneathiella chinensis]